MPQTPEIGGARGEDHAGHRSGGWETWTAGIYQGKRYLVPLDIHAMCSYINNPLFKSAGLWADGKPRAPKNQEEFLAACKALHPRGSVRCGLVAARGGPGILWQNGGDIFDAQGNRRWTAPWP